MQRIDGPGATQDNKFTGGDPQTATPATVVTPEWLNAVQEELANLVEALGGTLDSEQHDQVVTWLLNTFAVVTGSADQVFRVAEAVGANDAVPLAQTQSYGLLRFTAGGTGDAITGTLTPPITAYSAKLRVSCTPVGGNTLTAPTINIDGLGNKIIKKKSASGSKVALVAGDYNQSGPSDFEYDGVDFILLESFSGGAQYSDIRSIVKTASRDIAVDGVLTISGAGFAPKSAIVYMNVLNTAMATWGLASGAGQSSMNHGPSVGNFQNFDGNIGFIHYSSGNYSAVVLAFTSDGCTLTFSKAGSPVGTANIKVKLFR